MKINYLTRQHKNKIIQEECTVKLSFVTISLVDQLALKELKELIDKHGAESILAIVKAGQGVHA